MKTPEVTPILVKREGDYGWLASTPADYPYRFAAAGDHEAEAVENFREAVARWESLGGDDR
jgi:hypothetical protein